jgi:hypothetical protein
MRLQAIADHLIFSYNLSKAANHAAFSFHPVAIHVSKAQNERVRKGTSGGNLGHALEPFLQAVLAFLCVPGKK